MAFDPNPLADWIAAELAATRVIPEVLERQPDLTEAQAYQVQQALAERWMAGGDRLIGYKAAMTSKAQQRANNLSEPILGRLMASGMLSEAEPVPVSRFVKPVLEPEVAVVLKHDLEGPGVTRAMALAAIEGYAAAIEVGDIKSGDHPRSPQMTMVCNVMNGGQVFGSRLVSPSGLDLRVEGMVARINGEMRGSATAVEVMGDPVNSVVFLANKLGSLGGCLEGGQVLLTGSIIRGIPLHAGDLVDIAFSRLGEVRLRLSA